jgi:transposase
VGCGEWNETVVDPSAGSKQIDIECHPVAREFGLARVTVQKMLRYAVPPGYQRQQAVNRPKLGPWVSVIDAILEEDKSTPPKQRHTAKRIFERLREEHGFTGG